MRSPKRFVETSVGWLTRTRQGRKPHFDWRTGYHALSENALLQHYKGYAVYRIVQLPQIALSEPAKTALPRKGRLWPRRTGWRRWRMYILAGRSWRRASTDAGSGMAMVNPMQDELAQAMRVGKEKPAESGGVRHRQFLTPLIGAAGRTSQLGQLTKAETLFKERPARQGMPDWGGRKPTPGSASCTRSWGTKRKAGWRIWKRCAWSRASAGSGTPCCQGWKRA